MSKKHNPFDQAEITEFLGIATHGQKGEKQKEQNQTISICVLHKSNTKEFVQQLKLQ